MSYRDFKYIRFVMSNGDSVTLSSDKAKEVLASPQQIVLITDGNGEWTGKTINKAFIINTQPNTEAEREEAEIIRYNKVLPPSVEAEKERQERIRRKLAEIKAELSEKLGWDKRQ